MKKKIIYGIFSIFALFIVWFCTVWLADLVIKSRVPVKLPISNPVSSFRNQFVSAEGTWVIEGEKQGFPLQTTKITCSRKSSTCTSATGQITYGNTLNVEIDILEIVVWDETRVVYVDNSPNCVTYVYTIDLLTKTTNGLRQKREQPRYGSENDCKSIASQLRLTLRSGYEVGRSLEEDATPWFGQLALAPLKLFQ